MYHLATRTYVLVLLALVLSVPAYAAQQQVPTRANLNRKLTPKQAERRKMVLKMDKAKLCSRNKAVSFISNDVLKIPAVTGKLEGITVAKTAPRIDFGIVPVKPRFFFQTPPDEGGLWTIWGQGTYHNGKYYGSIGNHIFYDSRLHVIEYDPKTMSFRLSPELNGLAGLPITCGDGKIHGTVEFYGDDMYFMSYWGTETKDYWKYGYEGGRLMSYNFTTNKFRDFGMPLKRASWSYHRMDHKRGLFYGVGSGGQLLCYDVKNNKILFDGYLPSGMAWYSRALIVDEQTGCAYTANADKDDADIHIVKYDSNTNSFTKMKSVTPKTKSDATEGNYLRAYTPRKLKDGSFICVTRAGHMFKFWPELDKTEDLGFCWPMPPERLYTSSMAMSPDGKYVYYVPGAHGGTQRLGGAVVQYNTLTREKKALAFLFPSLYDKFGYITGGTYSVNMDDKGERLFIYMNGAFNNDPNGDVMGDPSVIVVHIPASERK